ncbi:MAG: hypothetical protein A2086_15090 [Spirochaetes bacterium GWD1_27_9]|nr:MAG: hypothetical protein A2Y34_08340 [Spirochaetes bacterium GWC1_27_15]OHD31089.1 MAG: hypothetical protein A2086_15090 [Spirochaetes bacterium GWD1_27_9]
MASVNVILNGNKIVSDDNLTILDLAIQNNIEIPTLCFDNRLNPYGSCFVCVVEVKGARTLIPACATKLREGIEIETNSDKVMASRKTALELILSNHYGDCVAPCKLTCPAGCDIQGYVGLVANKKYDDAIKLIKDTIPLPASIGRVCPKFCEEQCRRQYIEEPVAIDHIKRFVADWDLARTDSYTPSLKPKIGKKVAIVGGGPAGLSAAYYLTQEGVDVEIFEEKNILGGMLYFGIPQYRLPKEVLAKEVETITKLGMKINYGKIFGIDFNIDSLKKDGFDAVILAMGAWKAQNLGIPNETADGVLNGIKFLERVALKQPVDIHGKVAVVGGGNTAFDCARTALRMGASEVVMIYRRTKEEMPANEIEIHEAEEEGIKFQLLTAPLEVTVKKNRVTGLTCKKMKLGDPDASGRRSPMPIDGSDFTEEYNFIIAAIGQGPDYNILGEKRNDLVKDGKRLTINKETFQTTMPFLFAAGDYATGAATVVEALGSGKKAAMSALKFIKGEIVSFKPEFVSTREDLKNMDNEFFKDWDKKQREQIAIVNPEKRKTNFCEIESVFPEEQANKEASRCMECGCIDVYQCQLKKYADDYNAEETNYIGDCNVFKNDDSHRYLFREPSKCILCGRCVRLCSEKTNIGVYGYVKRGFETVVQPSFTIPLAQSDCVSCGVCISGCPVGAIVPKQPDQKKVPLKGQKIDSYCSHCSIGCANTVEVLSNSIYDIYENHPYLCEKGRFHFPQPVQTKETIDISKLSDFKDAIVYPTPSLSAEDYEALKEVSKKMNWKIANYYSQSSLWIAFANLKALPKMDFFKNELKAKSLVVFAGNIEKINPIALNRLTNIIKQDTTIFNINKEETIRLKNLSAKLLKSIDELKKQNLSDFAEIVLVLNPIDFDKTYGKDSSLNLYNYLTQSGIEVRTTLLSEGRNIYSFYDANNIYNESFGKKIYLQTLAGNDGKIEAVLVENGSVKYSFKFALSFQNDGTFLSSKNEYYQNIPLLNKNIGTLKSIFATHYGVDKIEVVKHKNLDKETQINKSAEEVSFPVDGFIKKYSLS